MSDNTKNIDIFDLISKYFYGETNEDETIFLENWVKESPENKKMFLTYKNIWIGSNFGKVDLSVNVNKEWENIQQRLNVDNKEIKLAHETNKTFKIAFKVAAVLAFVLLGFVAINYYLNKDNYTEYSSNEGVIEQILPDGSVINLNSNSEIKYKKNSENTREVELKGSAFFDVKPDKTKPFIISTQNIKVTVLGTSFSVDSREIEDNILVVVKTGKVSVKTGDNEVVLIAGEKAMFYKKDNKLVKQINKDVNFLSWKTQTIEFTNTNIVDVAKILSKTFNKTIVIDESVDTTNMSITTKFNQQSFSYVLNIIKETLDLRIKESDNEEIIMINAK